MPQCAARISGTMYSNDKTSKKCAVLINKEWPDNA